MPRAQGRLALPLFLLIPIFCLAAPTLADAPPHDEPTLRGIPTQVIETPYVRLIKIEPIDTEPTRSQARRRATVQGEGAGVPSFDGDTYSFHHQIGALIDDILECFSVHMSGMDDNTVAFDGLSELLDPYLDGTQPAIFEFETSNLGTGTNDIFFNSFIDPGADLFPEGFEDPESGTPLDAACIEIGIDDTLDGDLPVEVNMATIEASNSMGQVLPPTDITRFFSNPWDGRLSFVAQGIAGQGIDGLVLEMQIQQGADPNAIFADGFESGDASSWSDSTP